MGHIFKKIFFCWRFVLRQLLILETQGLQRKIEQRFFKIRLCLKYYKLKVFTSLADTRRCSVKRVFKNSLISNLTEVSHLTRLQGWATGVFSVRFTQFQKHLFCRTFAKGCFGIWVTYWFISYLCSRVMTYGFMVKFNMDVKGTKRPFRKPNVYRVTCLSFQLNTKKICT